MSAALRLGLARLRRRPGQTATQVARARRGGGAARRDDPLHRALAADDDRLGDPQRPARPAGPGRSLPPGAHAGRAGSPGSRTIAQASAAATAPFAGVSHRGAAGRHRAPAAGAILAVPPGYLRHIDTFRFLRGALRPGEVVLDQQLAATLRAQDRRHGRRLRLGAGRAAAELHGSAASPWSPPPTSSSSRSTRSSGRRRRSPRPTSRSCRSATFARDAGAGACRRWRGASPAAAAVPGTLSRASSGRCRRRSTAPALTGTPSDAFKRAGQIRNSLERSFPGRIQFVDNLSEALETAAGDALYAEALFIMLAVPGALLALGLAYLAALGTVDRDRRELALLRARGASRRQLVGDGRWRERASIGVLAGLLGAGLSLVAVVACWSRARSGSRWRGRASSSAPASRWRSPGLLAARLGHRRCGRCGERRRGRRGASATAQPLWQRLYLDFVALALSGLIYWLTASTGFSAVVNPDSNPTLSLSIYMFFAPGAALDRGDAAAGPPARARLFGVARDGACAASGGRRAGARFLLASAVAARGRRSTAA